jgi:alpha-beta hydrolase superfamily lysophospholipase
LISLRALTDPDRKPDVAAAVISSPFLALRLQVPPAKIWLARGMSRVFPAFSQKNALRVEDLTSDLDKQKARIADTLCHDVASARWFTEARDAQAHVRRQAAHITVPSLWVIGGDDPIADPTVSEPLARTVYGAEVHLLRGFKHEVWNERERAHPLGLAGAFVGRIATA